MAGTLGGDRVLYVATAVAAGDQGLAARVTAHRERRPRGWRTLEIGGGDLDEALEEADRWVALLLDSLTLWVSARMARGADEEETLGDFDRFLRRAASSATPILLVSDEVGLGVVPGTEAGRRFRDVLGLINQRAATAAEEVHLCVAGLPVRIK